MPQPRIIHRTGDGARPASTRTFLRASLRGRRGAFLDTKLVLADIAFDIVLETGIRIQPLPVWEDEWEHPENYSNPHLLWNIESEGIRL